MKFSALLSLNSVKVDRANNRINGVSIATVGEARGHGVQCDQTTLSQVQKCAKEYSAGLKVKFNPATFDHGPAGIAGRFDPQSYRIAGDQLLGDLLVSKHYPHRDYLFELAEEQPQNFGLSMEFSGPSEEVNGQKFARCEEIYAVTVVDWPAANKAGLFSAKGDDQPNNNKGDNMTAEELKAAIAEGIKPLNDRLDKTDAEIKKFSANTGYTEPTEEEAAAAGVTKEDSADAKKQKVQAFRGQLDQPLTVRGFMQMFARTGGRPAGHNGGEGASGGDGTQKDKNGVTLHKFSALVKKYTDAGMSKEVATFRAKEDDKDAYNDFVINGAKKEAK